MIGTLGYEGSTNTFYGQNAGQWTITSNGGAGPPDYNTFIGKNAGSNTQSGTNSWDGDYNTFVGYYAGVSNTTGNSNTFIGELAGVSNTTGNYNTFIGRAAGYSNTTGSGNVFLGYWAGANETGSNKLYIDNSDTSKPLIYGEFDNDIVTVNGKLGIGTTTPQASIDTARGDITVNGADNTGARKDVLI